MDNNEQINTEIKVLFDTIKKQAVDYHHAFENYQLMKGQFESMVKELSVFKDSMTTDITKKTEQYDIKIGDFISYISREYDKLKKEHSLVKNINILNEQQENIVNQLKDFLETSENKFNKIFKNVEEYRIDIKNIRKKAADDSDKMLKELINSFADKIDSSVSEKTETIKDDIIFRQRRIEGVLKSIEKDLTDLQREFTKNRNDFFDLVQKLSMKIDNEDPVAKTDNKSLIDGLNIRLEDLVSQVYENEQKISVLINDSDSNSDKNDSNRIDNNNILVIRGLRAKVTEFEYELNDYDKKAKTSYVIAFMSIVFALISILLTFV